MGNRKRAEWWNWRERADQGALREKAESRRNPWDRSSEGGELGKGTVSGDRERTALRTQREKSLRAL